MIVIIIIIIINSSQILYMFPGASNQSRPGNSSGRPFYVS